MSRLLRVGLGLRLLFGFFLIAGLAAVLLLRVFLAEVKPSVREVMEDVLVDAANLLAEQAAPDLLAMAPGGDLQGTRFAHSVADYAQRPIQAQIWHHTKSSLDFRVYVTDAKGRVVFDSGGQAAPGTDYSRWNDVLRTLRGEYGARATRSAPGDDTSTVMHVAAPIRDGTRIIGVLTVAKPVATVQPFIDRAERKIWWAGALLLMAAVLVGVLVSGWTIHSVRALRSYANRAQAGDGTPPPALPGELGELAQAMDRMRQRLDARDQVEQAVRSFTHELKTPLTAIQGAAELLHDDLPAADRERFALQIGEQAQRLRVQVDRMLELSKLDSLHRMPKQRVAVLPLLRAEVRAAGAVLEQRGLRVEWLREDEASVDGDAERLSLALSAVLGNALDFAPRGTAIHLGVYRESTRLRIVLRDHGSGVPEFALGRLGERYFSLPRVVNGLEQRGSGLGLAIARQVLSLHGGALAFDNASPGLRVTLHMAAAA